MTSFLVVQLIFLKIIINYLNKKQKQWRVSSILDNEFINFTFLAGNLSSNEIKEIFALFDKMNRGQVQTSELGTLVRALNLNPTETEITEM